MSLYVVGRKRFLNAQVTWPGASTFYLTLLNGVYQFNELDTQLKTAIDASNAWSVQPMLGLSASPLGWAASNPVSFPALNWPDSWAVTAAIVSQATGSPSDYTTHVPIAYLPEFSNAGFCPGNDAFVAQFDTGNNQEGWFRP